MSWQFFDVVIRNFYKGINHYNENKKVISDTGYNKNISIKTGSHALSNGIYLIFVSLKVFKL